MAPGKLPNPTAQLLFLDFCQRQETPLGVAVPDPSGGSCSQLADDLLGAVAFAFHGAFPSQLWPIGMLS